MDVFQQPDFSNGLVVGRTALKQPMLQGSIGASMPFHAVHRYMLPPRQGSLALHCNKHQRTSIAPCVQVLTSLQQHIDLQKARAEFGEGYSYEPQPQVQQTPPAAPPTAPATAATVAAAGQPGDTVRAALMQQLMLQQQQQQQTGAGGSGVPGAGGAAAATLPTLLTLVQSGAIRMSDLPPQLSSQLTLLLSAAAAVAQPAGAGAAGPSQQHLLAALLAGGGVLTGSPRAAPALTAQQQQQGGGGEGGNETPQQTLARLVPGSLKYTVFQVLLSAGPQVTLPAVCVCV
jgi:hypothetical protein